MTPERNAELIETAKREAAARHDADHATMSSKV